MGKTVFKDLAVLKAHNDGGSFPHYNFADCDSGEIIGGFADENAVKNGTLARERDYAKLFGESPRMLKLLRKMQKAFENDCYVCNNEFCISCEKGHELHVEIDEILEEFEK